MPKKIPFTHSFGKQHPNHIELSIWSAMIEAGFRLQGFIQQSCQQITPQGFPQEDATTFRAVCCLYFPREICLRNEYFACKCVMA